MDIDVARRLLTHTPDSRKVSGTLTVQFDGVEYDVRGIPGVMVGESLQIALSPYQRGAALVVQCDADGRETLTPVPAVERNDAGFRLDAPVIGEEWARQADTRADTNRKAVERVAMDADTDAEAEARRKAKALPFGGRVDPYKVIDQAPQRTFLPRRGADLVPAVSVSSTAAPVRVLTQFEAAEALGAMGVAMSRELVASLKALHPDGVPEDQIDALRDRLTVRAGLRVVAGGGA